MHIGIVGAVIVGDAVDDRCRLLRAGSRIKKDQIGVIGKNREFLLEPAWVEPAWQPVSFVINNPRAGRRHAYPSNTVRRRASRDSRCSRTAMGSTISTASRKKPPISIRRASSR